MGMYNEVYKKCPVCGSRGCCQISQITLGFGEFDLDDLDELAQKLNEEQLRELHQRVQGEWFGCQNKTCRHSFLLEDTKKARRRLAEDLFGDAKV